MNIAKIGVAYRSRENGMNDVMHNEAIERAYTQGARAMNRFAKAATYITKHYVSEIPGSPLTEEAKKGVSEAMSVNMATGAELVKGKYVLMGIAIGVVTTAVTAILVKKVMANKFELECTLRVSPRKGEKE